MSTAPQHNTATRPDHSQGWHSAAHQACVAVLAGLLALLGATALHAEPAPDAKVERSVIEDDAVRVEELRERGQTRQVTVHNKGSKAPAYEILMGDGSRDLSQGPGSTRGATGQRVWRLLDF
ncbi:hypothetical protein [Paucibacter soli]|uniref:hypothetical protein n=1 Tax=Paucibacter soli TaxID=3133433 RepID=UPI00309A30C3